MRIDELKLIAYGKFTDHRLPFPKVAHDFHVIIGPNEAGKSTLRRAITELLFGMARQSALGFKHPQSDLRLSAVLETATDKFAFIRSKQQKSLRSMTDEALPDAYLAPALGALTEETFTQLHCLDHERLLKGGQSIVDPGNSVSQILFQAASGLEGFAAIRDALGTRAGALFASRGRSNEYTKASERYMSAQKTLRDVQVRAKAWAEACDALKSAADALDTERKHRRELETQRSIWERARRLTPLVERLNRLEHELGALGETIAFPSNAKETLDSGMANMDAAAGIVRTREEDVLDRRQQLDAIVVDDKVLAQAAEIERLVQMCGRYANHSRDLPLRHAEVKLWLNEALTRSVGFSWGDTEEAMLARLPQEKTLRIIDALLKEQGVLLADERAAQDAEEERQAALHDLQDRLKTLPEATLDPQLAQALAQALPYKTSESRQKNLQSALTLADTAAKNAMLALGQPVLTMAALRAMQLPSPERAAAHRAARQDIVKACESAQSRAKEHEAAAADLGLQISQFVRSHKVVTVAEVSAARHERDEQWRAIKSGLTPLPDSAPPLDAAIRLADELVDARTLSETDGVTLQTLRDQLEKANEERLRQQQSAETRQHELETFDTHWAEQAAALGRAGMLLDDLPEWLGRREKALQAADILAERKHDYEYEHHGAAQAQDDLFRAIAQAGLKVSSALGLAALCTLAEDHIKRVEQAQMQRHALQQQLQTAHTALNLALKMKAAKAAAVGQWHARWREALTRAHLLDLAADITEVEAAVDAARFIQQRLEKIDTHRVERIQAMEVDLEQLDQAAQTLIRALALPAEQAPSSADELARSLHARLETAKRQSNRKMQAQEFLDGAQRQLCEARSALEQARRSLAPLLKAAAVAEPMLALPLVEKARKKTALQDALSETRAELEKSADGLSLEQVHAEVASHPAPEAPAQLMALKDSLEDSERKLTQLAQAQLTARQLFDTINGGEQAAMAEAQKQEALADMSEAGEEYLQLATANCLLKWAVDRYRERKQGPLLQHANAIFRNLTQGSFEKLRIDYDQSPPALLAYRSNNQAVKVSGLSDGTRDQLFLALRIAALELQAEQGAPVPFIADDLFINFDDKRSQAGLQALYALSAKTQVLFLSHQEHLLPVVQQAFPHANILTLEAAEAFA